MAKGRVCVCVGGVVWMCFSCHGLWFVSVGWFERNVNVCFVLRGNFECGELSASALFVSVFVAMGERASSLLRIAMFVSVCILFRV